MHPSLTAPSDIDVPASVTGAMVLVRPGSIQSACAEEERVRQEFDRRLVAVAVTDMLQGVLKLVIS